MIGRRARCPLTDKEKSKFMCYRRQIKIVKARRYWIGMDWMGDRYVLIMKRLVLRDDLRSVRVTETRATGHPSEGHHTLLRMSPIYRIYQFPWPPRNISSERWLIHKVSKSQELLRGITLRPNDSISERWFLPLCNSSCHSTFSWALLSTSAPLGGFGTALLVKLD